MLKTGTKVVNRKGLNHVIGTDGTPLRFKPWLGDSVSFLYDFIMKSSIFPKKFAADVTRHHEILSQELKDIHEKRVLELATGTGSAVSFLPSDNQYTGTDISPGLLKKAVKNFRQAGFKNVEYYVTSADDLPFDDGYFDLVLCILSLNFMNDVHGIFQEIKRVSRKDAVFVCSVPVPERNKARSTIRGTLYSEAQLEDICWENGFSLESIPADNGVLMYFRAVVRQGES